MIPLLKGLRILDLTSVILGPYGTQILGDLGAEVIKVEPPEGDSMRPVAPVAAPGMSAIFANFNRNKRSVALDLKSEGGKAALRKLIATGDVFVHNMRQEAMDKLGFTFNAVREANPRIVYAAAVGFGRHGRYAGKPAYDDVIQAASGFAGLFQMRDGAPLYAPSIVADKISGLHLAYAVMAALLHRERTGEAPGYVEVPMFELMAAFSLSEHMSAATFEEEGRVGYVRVISPSRRPYRTRDGWVGVLPYTERNWTKILHEIGRADVAALDWFRNATERSRRVDELYDILAVAMAERTTAEWLATFERLGTSASSRRSSGARRRCGAACARPSTWRPSKPRPTCRRPCWAPIRPTFCVRRGAAKPRSPQRCRAEARANCHPRRPSPLSSRPSEARAGTQGQRSL
jgi:crotonobetainyl-CoA:carnitine CoA-transferase CaiB-like acyl-CoA transferase